MDDCDNDQKIYTDFSDIIEYAESAIPPSNEARTYYGEIILRSLIAKVYGIKLYELLLKALKLM